MSATPSPAPTSVPSSTPQATPAPSSPEDVLRIYDGAKVGAYASPSYMVEISEGREWIPAFTYGVTNKSINYFNMNARVTASFLTFAASKEVEVRVKYLPAPVETVKISPQSRNVAFTVDDEGIRFRMRPMDKYWITVNGLTYDTLMVFADAPIARPSPNDLYFGPGVHDIGLGYRPKDGQTIYIDGGAWVKGTFDIRGLNGVTFTGHGVLSGETFTDQGILGYAMDFETAKDYVMFRGEYGRSATGNSLSHITVVDAPFYFTFGGISDFYGVKLISPWYWSNDGFYVSPDTRTGKGSVRECFAFTDDNVFFPLQSHFGDIEVSGCFVGTVSNNVFCMSYWPWRMDHDYAYKVKDVDVKAFSHYNPHAIFQLILDGSAGQEAMGTKNQYFEDIRIEGNPKCSLFDIQNQPYPWGGSPDSPTTGNSYNIHFKDIVMYGKPDRKSVIKGRDAQNGHHDYFFENIVIGGMRLTLGNFDEYFDTNEFTSNIRNVS